MINNYFCLILSVLFVVSILTIEPDRANAWVEYRAVDCTNLCPGQAGNPRIRASKGYWQDGITWQNLVVDTNIVPTAGQLTNNPSSLYCSSSSSYTMGGDLSCMVDEIKDYLPSDAVKFWLISGTTSRDFTPPIGFVSEIFRAPQSVLNSFGSGISAVTNLYAVSCDCDPDNPTAMVNKGSIAISEDLYLFTGEVDYVFAIDFFSDEQDVSRHVFLHELGHLWGFGHDDNQGLSVMNTVAWHGSAWNRGDYYHTKFTVGPDMLSGLDSLYGIPFSVTDLVANAFYLVSIGGGNSTIENSHHLACPGESFTMVYTDQNRNTSASNKPTSRFYLSSDPYVTTSSILIGAKYNYIFSPLEARSSQKKTYVATIPTGLPPGASYYSVYKLSSNHPVLFEAIQNNETNFTYLRNIKIADDCD